MIVKEEKQKFLYERFGLFTEAPKRKRRPRVISVRASRGQDYSDQVEPEEEFDIDNTDDDYAVDDLDIELDEPVDDTDGDGTEVAADDTDGETEEPPADEQPADTDADPAEGDADATTDDTGGEEVPAEGDVADDTTQQDAGDTGDGEDATATDDTGADAGDAGDDTGGETIDVGDGNDGAEDYTDDIGEDPTQDMGTDDGTGDATATDGVDGAVEQFNKNDMRKFQLYKKFMQMHEAIQYCISKLESIISDDAVVAAVNSHALKALGRLESITQDYMTLKFRSDSYAQNSLFFEKLRAVTLLTVESLNTNKSE